MAKYALVRNGMGNYVSGTGAKEDDLLYISNYYLYQSGVVDSGDLLVSQRAAGANMSVDVAAGKVFIPNAAYVVNTDDATRFWVALNDTVTNVVVPANTSGNPRIDIIVIKMDTALVPDANASNVITIELVQGSPAGSPSAPATPSNCYKLAEVAVANGAVTIINANITDSRQRAYIDSEKLSPISYSKISEYGDTLIIANNKKVQWRDSGGALDSYIFQDSSDHVRLRLATAAKSFVIEDSTGDIKFEVNTNSSYVGAINGYALRAYSPGNDKYFSITQDDVNCNLLPSANGQAIVLGLMPRNPNGGSTTYENSHIQRGYVVLQGDGTDSTETTVTLPITYGSTHFVVLATPASFGHLGSPSDESGASGPTYGLVANVRVASTSTFDLTLKSPAVMNSSDYYLVHWVTIGQA